MLSRLVCTGCWLAVLAVLGARPQSTHAQSPKPAAVRKRDYRARSRRGAIKLRVEIHECDLAEAMILSGRLSEPQALDRSELVRAAALVLREWSDRWRKG